MIQIALSPDQFAALAAKAEQQGIPIVGTEGEIQKSGVKAGYKYAEGQLQIVVLEKPFFVTTEYCEEQLKKFLG
jgi:hypothetical protein